MDAVLPYHMGWICYRLREHSALGDRTPGRPGGLQIRYVVVFLNACYDHAWRFDAGLIQVDLGGRSQVTCNCLQLQILGVRALAIIVQQLHDPLSGLLRQGLFDFLQLGPMRKLAMSEKVFKILIARLLKGKSLSSNLTHPYLSALPRNPLRTSIVTHAHPPITT